MKVSCLSRCRFQSTLPARGATLAFIIQQSPFIFQSTLPARGATRGTNGSIAAYLISIHAPRTGSDYYNEHLYLMRCISIHAPRTGSDKVAMLGERADTHFNPRSPHGERLVSRIASSAFSRFQSTLPTRGATTIDMSLNNMYLDISIHAPRTGSDATLFGWRKSWKNFNPRSPHGERPKRREGGKRGNRISIHAPRTGSDCLPFRD